MLLIILMVHMVKLNYGMIIMYHLILIINQGIFIYYIYISSNWWWITLIVVFGVAILGVGGYFVYKKFINKGVEPLLG